MSSIRDPNWKGYSHSYKYNPDANYNNNEWGLLNSLEFRHSLNTTTYYTVRGSYNINDYKQYLYPLLDAATAIPCELLRGIRARISTIHADPRYQPDYKSTAAAPYTFLSGGTRNGQYYQRSTTWERQVRHHEPGDVEP